MSQDFGVSTRVIASKNHRCEYCYGPIVKGESHWNYRGMYGGAWHNWRMHDECFASYDDDGDGEFMPGCAPYPARIAKELEEVEKEST